MGIGALNGLVYAMILRLQSNERRGGNALHALNLHVRALADPRSDWQRDRSPEAKRGKTIQNEGHDCNGRCRWVDMRVAMNKEQTGT